MTSQPHLLELPLSYTPRNSVKRVGIIALSTDHTTEIEFTGQVGAPGTEVFTARVEFENPMTPQNLRAMLPLIEQAAASILPDTPLDVVFFSCTSGSVHIGDAKICKAIQNAKPDAKIVTPTLAAVAAFEALKIKKLALLTPYAIETSAPLEPYFEEQASLEVVRHCCLGLEDDRDVAQLDKATLMNAALKADHHDAEAMFISCTAVRILDFIGEIEQAIGKPVITSNQSAVWQCLQLLGEKRLTLPDNRLFKF